MFFYQGHNQKLATKRGLDLTAISLSVSYKQWFGPKPFEVNATVAMHCYRKKMQTNKMLSKAFNFALDIDTRAPLANKKPNVVLEADFSSKQLLVLLC